MRTKGDTIDLLEQWNVPYSDTPEGIKMQNWGDMPPHLIQALTHEQRTGGKNRAQRRQQPARKPQKTPVVARPNHRR